MEKKEAWAKPLFSLNHFLVKRGKILFPFFLERKRETMQIDDHLLTLTYFFAS